MSAVCSDSAGCSYICGKWIQCTKCFKYRKIPLETDDDWMPDDWECANNRWYTELASCKHPQEYGPEVLTAIRTLEECMHQEDCGGAESFIVPHADAVDPENGAHGMRDATQTDEEDGSEPRPWSARRDQICRSQVVEDDDDNDGTDIPQSPGSAHTNPEVAPCEQHSETESEADEPADQTQEQVTETERTHQLKYPVNTALEVWRSGEKSFFPGRVRGFHSGRNVHEVTYDDGKFDELDLSEEVFSLGSGDGGRTANLLGIFHTRHGGRECKLDLPEWSQPQRLVARRLGPVSGQTEYLVKWGCADDIRGYDSCTWELANTGVLHGGIDSVQQLMVEAEARIRKAEKRLIQSRHSLPKTVSMLERPPDYLANKHRLHPRQLEALNWLRHAWLVKRNVMLADEAGSSETVTAVAYTQALLQEFKVACPVLVVVPRRLLKHWLKEFKLWAPDTNVVVFIGSSAARATIWKHEVHDVNMGLEAVKAEVVLTTLTTVVKSCSILKTTKWASLVMDDGHTMESAGDEVKECLQQMHFSHRVLITKGQPQSTLENLLSLVQFSRPGVFADVHAFRRRFASLDESAMIYRLHALLGPHLLRRAGSKMVSNVAPRHEVLVPVYFTPVQAETYQSLLSTVPPNSTPAFQAYSRAAQSCDTLSQLRQVCNHPYLLDPVADQPHSQRAQAHISVSGKVQLLDSMLCILKRSNRRVLVFSQSTKMLDLLEEYVHDKFGSNSSRRSDSSTNAEQRQAATAHFNDPNSGSFVFLLCARAHNLDLDLLAADVAVIYDSSVCSNVQAFDNWQRLGQTEPMIVYRLFIRMSVEERLLKPIFRKRAEDSRFCMPNPSEGGSEGAATEQNLSQPHSHVGLNLGQGADTLAFNLLGSTSASAQGVVSDGNGAAACAYGTQLDPAGGGSASSASPWLRDDVAAETLLGEESLAVLLRLGWTHFLSKNQGGLGSTVVMPPDWGDAQEAGALPVANNVDLVEEHSTPKRRRSWAEAPEDGHERDQSGDRNHHHFNNENMISRAKRTKSNPATPDLFQPLIQPRTKESPQTPIQLPSREPIADPIQTPTHEHIPGPIQPLTHELIPGPIQPPTHELIPGPIQPPTHELITGPIQPPTHELIPGPIQTPTCESIHDPTQEPTQDPISDPIQPPTQEPMPNPIHPSAQEPIPDSFQPPTHESIPGPIQPSTHESILDPVQESTQDPIHTPTQEPVPDHIQAPPQGSIHNPIRFPIREPTQPPVQLLMHDPFIDPIIQPPVQIPIESPFQTSVETPEPNTGFTSPMEDISNTTQAPPPPTSASGSNQSLADSRLDASMSAVECQKVRNQILHNLRELSEQLEVGARVCATMAVMEFVDLYCQLVHHQKRPFLTAAFHHTMTLALLVFGLKKCKALDAETDQRIRERIQRLGVDANLVYAQAEVFFNKNEALSKRKAHLQTKRPRDEGGPSSQLGHPQNQCAQSGPKVEKANQLKAQIESNKKKQKELQSALNQTIAQYKEKCEQELNALRKEFDERCNQLKRDLEHKLNLEKMRREPILQRMQSQLDELQNQHTGLLSELNLSHANNPTRPPQEAHTSSRTLALLQPGGMSELNPSNAYSPTQPLQETRTGSRTPTPPQPSGMSQLNPSNTTYLTRPPQETRTGSRMPTPPQPGGMSQFNPSHAYNLTRPPQETRTGSRMTTPTLLQPGGMSQMFPSPRPMYWPGNSHQVYQQLPTHHLQPQPPCSVPPTAPHCAFAQMSPAPRPISWPGNTQLVYQQIPTHHSQPPPPCSVPPTTPQDSFVQASQLLIHPQERQPVTMGVMGEQFFVTSMHMPSYVTPITYAQMTSSSVPSFISVQGQSGNQAPNAALHRKRQELQQKSKQQHPEGNGLRLRVAGEPMTGDTVNHATSRGVPSNQTAVNWGARRS